MAELFERTVLNSLVLSNRFVRSATWEGLAAPGGYGTKKLGDLWTDLARGKVGLIITGHAYVSPEGQAAPAQLGIYTDGHVPSLKEMVDKVHEAGGKIALQVSHGGRYALKLPDAVRIGPSTFENKGEVQCREMTVEEIQRTVAQFAGAARRAKAASFDAIQIHAAHGYLLSQFLSPFFNKRSDAYGGPVCRRAALLLDVVRAVRHEVGDGFPVFVKLNSQDFLIGGFTPEEMLEVASLLQDAAVDGIEMSGGHHLEGIFGQFFPARTGRPEGEERPYYLDESRLYKKRVQVPLMLVGGIRSLEWATRVVSERIADYVSLCRPLIREPRLIEKWKSGDTTKSACVSDNDCFNPALKGEGVHCTRIDKEMGR